MKTLFYAILISVLTYHPFVQGQDVGDCRLAGKNIAITIYKSANPGLPGTVLFEAWSHWENGMQVVTGFPGTSNQVLEVITYFDASCALKGAKTLTYDPASGGPDCKRTPCH